MNPISPSVHSHHSLFSIREEKTRLPAIYLRDTGEAEEGYVGSQVLPNPEFKVPEAKDFCTALNSWVEYAHHSHYSESVKIRNYFNWLALLPPPEDEYWNQIPQNLLNKCIEMMAYISCEIERSALSTDGLHVNHSTITHRDCAVNFYFIEMMSVAITYRFMCCLYPEKMRGWGISWDRTFINRVLEGKVFFNRPDLQARLMNLTCYMKDLTDPQKSSMFWFFNIDSVSKHFLCSGSCLRINEETLSRDWGAISKDEVKGRDQHFKFLSQFITPPYSKEAFFDFKSKKGKEAYNHFECLVHQLFRLKPDRTFLSPLHEFARLEEGRGNIEYYPPDVHWAHIPYGLTMSPLLPQNQMYPHDCPLLKLPKFEGENADLCTHIELADQYEMNISEKGIHELASLAAPYNQTNRIALIVQWMQKNPTYLRSDEIQRYLSQLTLCSRVIEEAPQHAINDLRKKIHETIQGFYDGSSRERHHAIFWIRLGYYIEGRIASQRRREDFIEAYQNMIGLLMQDSNLQLLHLNECRLTRILLFGHCDTISPEMAGEFTAYLFQANELLKENKNLECLEFLRIEAAGLMLQWQEPAKSFFKNVKMSQWFNEISVIGIPPDTRFYRQYPILRTGVGHIDLGTGVFYGGGVQKYPISKTIFKSPELATAIGLAENDPVEFDPAEEGFYTLDGTARGFIVYSLLPKQPLCRLGKDLLTPGDLEQYQKKVIDKEKKARERGEKFHATNRRKQVVIKKFNFEGAKGGYRYLDIELNRSLPLPDAIKSNYSYWLSTEGGNNRHILILDQQRLPYAKVIHLEQDNYVCVKLNKEAQEQDKRLVEFKSLTDKGQQALCELFDPKLLQRALIWAKPNDKFYVITSIEIPSLELSFTPKVKANGVQLISDQFKDYHLLGSEEKSLCHLGKDLLFFRKKDERFACIPKENAYIKIIWNKRRKTFSAKNSEEQLEYIFYLIEHGIYWHACQALRDIQPFKYYNMENYLKFSEKFKAGKSLEKILAYLHVALHFLENQNHFFTLKDSFQLEKLREKLIEDIQVLLGQLHDCPHVPEEHVLGIDATHKKILELYGLNKKSIPSLPIQSDLNAKYHPKISLVHSNTLPERFYQKKSFVPKQESFPLNRPLHTGCLLANTLYDNLVNAHNENCKKIKDIYVPNIICNKDNLKNDLSHQIKKNKKELRALTEKIEQQANQQASEKITIHYHIYHSFLYQKPQLLLNANAGLSCKDVFALWNSFMDIMLLQSQIDQFQEALLWVEKLSSDEKTNQGIHKEIAKILYKKRHYDPIQNPEYLAYEYATGFLLRPEQVDLLHRINQHADQPQQMIEFQAGGGKTQVIAPLISHAAIQQGRMPIFVSLPAMYDYVKHDFKTTLSTVFDIKTHVLEIDLETDLTEADLKHVLFSLETWHKENAALVIRPITYHRLHMQIYRDLEKNGSKTASEILRFFRDHGLFIIDEAHRNLISTWQAITASAPISCLSVEEQNLFIQIYRLLTGVDSCRFEDGTEIGDLIGLIEDRQTEMNTSERKNVLRAIARWLCIHYFKIPQEQQDSLVDFFCKVKSPLPHFLTDLSESEQSKFFLARGLLSQVLKVTLNLRHQFDYGAPIAPYKVEMPRFSKMPTHAQFADPDLTAALSCQGLYQRGLDISQFEEMLRELKAQHDVAQRGHTREALLFREWQQQCGIVTVFNFEALDYNENITFLHGKLGKMPEVVEYYLVHHLLDKVKSYTRQSNSTAADLAAAGKSIAFSATLGFPEEYPARTVDDNGNIQRAHEADFEFQAAVIAQACMPQNSDLYWINPLKNTKDFFEQLYVKNANLFHSKLEGLIDASGWHRQVSTKEVALTFLEFNREKKLGYNGALYIQETGHSTMQVILALDDRTEYIDVQGSDYRATLKNKGIDVESLRLFKIFGPSQATGTDIYLSNQAVMLLTTGPENTLWGQIQAMMRCRRFLEPNEDPEQGQRIVWVGSVAFEEKIAAKYKMSKEDITQQHIMQWGFQKELEAAGPRIILQACQSIARVFREHLEEKVEKDFQYVQKHSGGIFFNEISRNLALTYACYHESKPVRNILHQYVQSLESQSVIGTEEIDGAGMKIEAIIREAESQLRDIKTQATSQAIDTVQAQQEQQQQQRQVTQLQQSVQPQRSPAPDFNYAHAELACHGTKITLPHTCDPKIAISANQLFCRGQPPLFYQRLYLLGNILTTTVEDEISLKDIDFLLIVWPKNEEHLPFIYCVSQTDAHEYARQLDDANMITENLVVLTTSLGGLVRNSQANGMSEEKWNAFVQESTWQQVMHQIALLNGEILDSSEFGKKLVEPWKDAGIDVQTIQQAFVGLCKQKFMPPNPEYLLCCLEQGRPTARRTVPKPKTSVLGAGDADVNERRPTQHQEIASQPSLQNISEKVTNEAAAEATQVSKQSRSSSAIRITLIVCAILGSLGFGILGGLSLMGGHWVHAPDFAINLYKALPLPVTYTSVVLSAVMAIGFIGYAMMRLHTRAPSLTVK